MTPPVTASGAVAVAVIVSNAINKWSTDDTGSSRSRCQLTTHQKWLQFLNGADIIDRILVFMRSYFPCTTSWFMLSSRNGQSGRRTLALRLCFTFRFFKVRHEQTALKKKAKPVSFFVFLVLFEETRRRGRGRPAIFQSVNRHSLKQYLTFVVVLRFATFAPDCILHIIRH